MLHTVEVLAETRKYLALGKARAAMAVHRCTLFLCPHHRDLYIIGQKSAEGLNVDCTIFLLLFACSFDRKALTL